jgi:hypothetical protein
VAWLAGDNHLTDEEEQACQQQLHDLHHIEITGVRHITSRRVGLGVRRFKLA